MNKYNSKTLAKLISTALVDWKIYTWHEASTGSIYLKFPHWNLGSIRIGDHKGRTRYSYRWEWRLEAGRWKCFFQGSETSYNLEGFLEAFEEMAAEKGIKPGDVQTWEDFKGVEVPEWKARKYNRRG